MVESRIPQVDFSLIPTKYEGCWVVVRVGSGQRVLGSGSTADEAVTASGVASDDLTAILTQVPAEIPVAYVGQSDSE